jgi:iron complex outermembrane receptor protein
VGVNAQALGGDDRITFHQALYPDAESDRVFPTFALGASYQHSSSQHLAVGVFAETVTEAPQTEALFIAVQKPAGKPWWAGNPMLDAPARSTARAALGYRWLQVETFASYVVDYTELTRRSIGARDYMTYRNVDALLSGFDAQIDSRHLDVDASWVWAENRTTGGPLSEIAPFRVRTRLTSSSWHGAHVFVAHTYSDAQTRVDAVLGETATPSWNRLDLGLRVTRGPLEFRLDAENITDETYFRHLSFLRDPFASGVRVYEPGATVRLSVQTTPGS